MNKENPQRKLYNIEFIRFVFAVCIVCFHLLHSSIMPYTEKSQIYRGLAEGVRNAKYIVECFFIMSGYFLYHSIQNHPGQSTGDFLWHKAARLWPPLACSVIIMAVFFGKNFYASFLDLLFLQSSGLATDWQGLNWYVSAFFLAEVFYFMLCKAVSNPAKRRLIVCLLVYFGYALNVNVTDGGFGRGMAFGVFNMGIARAVSGIGLGLLTGEFYDTICRKWNRKSQDSSGIREFVIISLMEAGSGIFLVVDFFFYRHAYKNQLIVVILFWIFFVCMLTGKGLFSRITDHPFMALAGRYAYSIYVMQEVSFATMKKTWWKNTSFVHDHVLMSLIFSVTVAVGTGILVYHLVEKPASEKLKGLKQVMNL